MAPAPGLAEAYATCMFALGVTLFGRIVTDRPRLEQVSEELDAVIRQAEAENGGVIHPMLRIGRVVMAVMTGREVDAAALIDEYVTGDDLWLASSALMIGSRGSEEGMERAVAGFRKLGDRWGLSEALLGLAAIRTGDGRPVDDLFAEIGTLTTAWVSPNETIGTLTRLATMRAQGGDLDGAMADLDRARVGLTGDVAPEVVLQFTLAEATIDYLRGAYAESLAACESVVATLGDAEEIPQLVAVTRVQYGRTLTATGQLDAALDQHLKALAVMRGGPDLPILIAAVSGVALTMLARGEIELAARLFGASNDTAADTLAGRASAGSALGRERFEALAAEGAALSTTEVYDLIGSIR